MSNTLYLECLSGISGDMTVAALLDLGTDRQVLEKALDSLPVDGFSIEIKRVVKSGLDVCDFNVVLDKAHENNDHDMEYLHGKETEKICRLPTAQSAHQIPVRAAYSHNSPYPGRRRSARGQASEIACIFHI